MTVTAVQTDMDVDCNFDNDDDITNINNTYNGNDRDSYSSTETDMDVDCNFDNDDDITNINNTYNGNDRDSYSGTETETWMLIVTLTMTTTLQTLTTLIMAMIQTVRVAQRRRHVC